MSLLPSNDPGTRHTLQTIQAFHRAFNRHAVDQIMALMTDDCIFENTYPPPDGDRLQGAATVRAYWQHLFETSPQASFAIEELFAAGERAVLRWRYSWQAADGGTGHVRGVDIFRVRAGRVTEKLSYVKG